MEINWQRFLGYSIILVIFLYGISFAWLEYNFYQRLNPTFPEADHIYQKFKEIGERGELKEGYLNRILADSLNHITLSLDSVHSSYIPDQIIHLASLKSLKIVGDSFKLQSLQFNIHRMKSLEKLDLSNHELKEVPHTLAGLRNLKVLDLSKNANVSSFYDKAKALLPPGCQIIY